MTRTAKLIRITTASLALSAFFAIGAAAADLGVGTITADALRLRAEPSTSSSILATAFAGSRVVVLQDTGTGWYKVDYNTVEGYMYSDHLSVTASADTSLGYAYINTGSSTLSLRAGAGTGYDRLASVPGGSVLPISGMCNGWYKVSYAGKTGYVSGDYVILVKDSNGTRADGSNVRTESLGSKIATYAKQYLGCPYVYGASGPNQFDCSGFTKYIYAQFGYTLNRTATDQLSNGVSVSRSELQPGDLVFFKHNTSKPVSHVGIYIGEGQFIHASTTGDTVKISDLSSGYYSSVFVYARRIV